MNILFFHENDVNNGKWCIYIALSKALYNDECALQSFTHAHTHGRGNHARHQPAFRSRAQGHFDTNTGGARGHCCDTVTRTSGHNRTVSPSTGEVRC